MERRSEGKKLAGISVNYSSDSERLILFLCRRRVIIVSIFNNQKPDTTGIFSLTSKINIVRR